MSDGLTKDVGRFLIATATLRGGLTTWEIQNRQREVLGQIRFNGAWREHVFLPRVGVSMEFSHECLDALAHFLRDLNQESRTRDSRRRHERAVARRGNA